MLRKISKILKWLATGSAALAIAACYGVLYTYKQLIVKVSNRDDKAISGLRVTCQHNPMGFCLDTETGDSGETLFHLEEDGTADLYVQDIDGPGNSGYFKSHYREVKQVAGGIAFAVFCISEWAQKPTVFFTVINHNKVATLFLREGFRCRPVC